MPDPSIITEDTLNDLYGDVGRTFKTHDQAVDYAERIKGARISPVWNDVTTSGRRLAARKIIGYLVSIDPPPPPPPRYTGKVRTQ